MATYIFKTVQWKRGLISLFAGTPLDKDGKPVNDATAVGILAEDIFAPEKREGDDRRLLGRRSPYRQRDRDQR